MEIKVESPNQQELIAQAQTMLSAAEAMRVTDVDTYTVAATERQTLKGRIKALNDRRLEITRPLDEAKKSIMALFNTPIDLLTKADNAIRTNLLAYDAEQERKRRAEEDRLREIARKEQERLRQQALEAQRKAAEKAAELQRQLDEAARRQREAEQAGRAEEAAKAAAEAAKLAAKAESVIEKAADKAADLQQQADSMPTPIVAAAPVKVAGQARVTTWHARILDPMLVPREYLIVNEAALQKVAQATKGAIQIPGVEFYDQQGLRSSAR
jgi:colicin import membrane protein